MRRISRRSRGASGGELVLSAEDDMRDIALWFDEDVDDWAAISLGPSARSARPCSAVAQPNCHPCQVRERDVDPGNQHRSASARHSKAKPPRSSLNSRSRCGARPWLCRVERFVCV